MRFRPVCHSSMVLLIALAVTPAPAHGHVLIFKDGFTLAGEIKAPGGYIYDVASKTALWSGSGEYTLDTGARRILFSTGQVADVLDRDLHPSPEIVRLESQITQQTRYSPSSLARAIGIDPWDEHWDRKYKFMSTAGTRVTIPQHLAFLSPHYARVDSRTYEWRAYYLTSELSPNTVRSLLQTYPGLKSQSDRLDPAWRFQVYHFFVQAGWYDMAEEELKSILKDLPNEKAKVDAAREQLARLRALQLYDEIQLAHQANRFRWVRDHLGKFPREGVDEKSQAVIRSLKGTYDSAGEMIDQVKRYLEELPLHCPLAHRKMYQGMAKEIQSGLDVGNIDRLGDFLVAARQAEIDKRNDKTPKEAYEILARAMSGWFLGKDASDDKVELARRIWKAHDFVRAYQREDDDSARAKLLKTYLSFHSDALPVDVVAQIVPNLTPPYAETEFIGKPMELRTKLPTGTKKGIPYVIQLPPEYHHARAYPVVFALRNGGETPRNIVDRMADLAGRHGYILVAPDWGNGAGTYEFTGEEHAAVLDVLRDIGRRFSIDNDRVFLFGWGEGGNMAFDVGLSHPDLFAGVLPMGGWCGRHGERYWPNSLELPFYVVDGDLSGPVGEKNFKFFRQKWTPLQYPSLYVLYKGRGVEWFSGELPTMFDWMDHKRGRYVRSKAFPEMARLASLPNRAFQILRSTDTHFYWLSSDQVAPGHVIDGKWNARATCADLYGRFQEGNTIYLVEHNLKQLTIWLGKGMIDFTKPVTVRVNSGIRVNKRRISPSLSTMLEDLYERGDRQRLFWARIDLDL